MATSGDSLFKDFVPKKQRENVRHLGGSFYIVRTQAGFKKALRVYGKEYQVRGYPRSYPSLVSLSIGYCGYLYIRADCIHINKLTAALSS